MIKEACIRAEFPVGRIKRLCRITGDDFVGCFPKAVIDSYHDLISEFGLKISSKKHYVSETFMTFCQETYIMGRRRFSRYPGRRATYRFTQIKHVETLPIGFSVRARGTTRYEGYSTLARQYQDNPKLFNRLGSIISILEPNIYRDLLKRGIHPTCRY